MGLGGTPARNRHDNRQPRPRRCEDHRILWKRRPETGVVFLRKRQVRSCPDGAIPAIVLGPTIPGFAGYRSMGVGRLRSRESANSV